MASGDPERRETYVLLGHSESDDSEEEVQNSQAPNTSRPHLQPINVLSLRSQSWDRMERMGMSGSRQNSSSMRAMSSLRAVMEDEPAQSDAYSNRETRRSRNESSWSVNRLSQSQGMYDPVASHELAGVSSTATSHGFESEGGRRSCGVGRKGQFRASAFVSAGWSGLNHHHHGPRPSNPTRSSGRASMWRRSEVAKVSQSLAHQRQSIDAMSGFDTGSDVAGSSTCEDMPAPASAPRPSHDVAEAKLRNAQIAAAKAVSILTKMERQGYAGLEKNSVYGLAIAMPQIARSVGWSRTTLKHSIRSYTFLLVNFILQGLLLTYIGESIQIINPNTGQMHLCDFGAALTSWAAECPDAANCIGPDGTDMSLPRLYDVDIWLARKFVKTSLLTMFPDRTADIERMVDPGEYGVENYICRLVCCFLFTMSVVEDLRSTSTLAILLMKLPSRDESWIVWEAPTWAPKHEAKAMLGLSELDLVQFKIAGMSRQWKCINLLVVCVPKVLLWYGTVHAGFQFLMETSTITDVIINALAMTFLLQIDEMIFSRLSTESVRHIMENLKDYPLFDTKEEEEETEEDCLERFQRTEMATSLCQDVAALMLLFPRRFLVILSVMCFFVWEYYNRNCVRTEEGYVSKPMYLPSVSNTGLFSFLFGTTPHHEEEPFWSWSDVVKEAGEEQHLVQ